MAKKATLAYKRKEKTTIGGIGDFREDYDPLEVPADVAHQYDTPEMKEAGWVVTWKEEPMAAPKPAPTPAPVPAATSVPHAQPVAKKEQ